MNLKKNAGYVLPALGAVVLLLLGWALLKSSSGYPDYILPGPGTVWSAFVDHRMEIYARPGLHFFRLQVGCP